MARPYVLLLATLLSTLLSHLQPSAARNAADQKALLAIKSFFRNPPSLSSWDPATDCCSSWNTIICDSSTGRVTTVTIANDPSISSTIPPTIADLPFLDNIVLYNLNLSGPITTVFAALPNLTGIDLSRNALSGPIPSYLSSMAKLQAIVLPYNRLTGSIPPGLSSPPGLVEIDLSNNLLSGPIPDTFGSFRSPGVDLYLSNNRLSDPVPRSLGSYDFFELDLSHIQLSGDASFLFNRNDKRDHRLRDISYNLFEFNLSKVEFPRNLLFLYLNNNRIYGSIPQQILKLRLLRSLNVSYNNLCGQIPVGGRMALFDASSYAHNLCLCETPLPPCK